MKQGKGRNYFVVFFVIVAASTISVQAQEFRGFYGSSRDVNNHAPSSRFNRSGRYKNNNSGYISSNSDALNYQNNPSYNGGYSYQPYDENRSAYPAANLTINIFSADYTPAQGTPEYYNRSTENNYYNRNSYPSNNNNKKIPAGIKTTKINGDRFYEMNGNYYRADRFENSNPINYQTNQPQEKYIIVKGQQPENGVYIPANNGGSNSDNFADGYNSLYNTNTGKRRADNTVSILQNQQKALQDENDRLKRKLNEQQAAEVEQQRRLQMLREENQAQKQQEAQKNDLKLKEAKTNNETEANAFYSNLNVGDTVDQIPQNSKVITIDTKKTYISPRNIYYQKQKNGKFTVVGMGGK